MLDHTDFKIIEELAKNSRIKMKELGEKVHLTGQAASARVAKLEDLGVIEGYTIKINEEKLGNSVHAMINIFMSSPHHQAYLDFLKEQKRSVINNYKTSGESCYILECKFSSNTALDAFLVTLSKYAGYKVSIVINK
ncbi:MAG: Lrp/AsnC family transcriptional regulator [Cytobacillus gottheilii]|uniref:Lrp/AsnC family transcriptional regulator n=1 Tax=Cytobacillus gottheilii TaxID=859144 RepID=UPI0008321B31|nr:Lrp/AsnC family transcriptional regulator [Cytobacillus gottheilii]